jgi:hypothetical protein
MQQDVYVHLFGRPLAAHLLYHHSSCDGVTIAHDSQSTAGSLIMANQQKSFVLDENDKFFICGELAVLIVGSGAAGDERRHPAASSIYEPTTRLIMAKRLTTEDFISRARQKHGDKYIYDIINVFIAMFLPGARNEVFRGESFCHD